MRMRTQLKNYLYHLLSNASDDIHDGGQDSGYWLEDPDYTYGFLWGVANMETHTQDDKSFVVRIDGVNLKITVEDLDAR
jgi:hypothetical protein